MADSTNSETRKERRAAARAERARIEAARARTRKRLWQLGGVVALAVVVIVAIVLATGSGGEKNAGEGGSLQGAAEVNALFSGVTQRGDTIGDPNAPVTLVEYADLQCPVCRQFSETTLPTLVDEYVRTGKVKLVFASFPFIGDDSIRGAQMAEAVGLQDRLWEFVDIMYRNQGGENSGWVTDQLLRDVAGAIPGVDVDRAMDDRGIARVQDQLAADEQRRMEFGIDSTPSFLIGRDMRSLQLIDTGQVSPFDIGAFTDYIDQHLEQAQR